MKQIIYGIVGVLLLCFPGQSVAEDGLYKRISDMLQDKKAEVGVAVILNGKDTVTVGDGQRYPLMSVIKLHQALAVADYCGRNGLGLDTRIEVKPSDLKPDTYSPLRDKYPSGEVTLTVKELLDYTLLWSDNNACDILFRLTGGPEATDAYIRQLGIKDFAIAVTEDAMHRHPERCYQNWSTPLATACVLEKLLTKELFNPDFQHYIQQALIACQTGKERLPHPLIGTQAVIGHKTGTGDRNADGQIIGINDAGFVFLPDGQRYTIVVFVKDSEESASDTAAIIADVSRTVYRFMASLAEGNPTDSLQIGDSTK